MIIRFENLLGGSSFTKNLTKDDLEKIKTRALWSVDDEIYWVNKVIHFESHVNVLLTPLYAWECMVSNGEWSIFDTVSSDEIYSKKLSDKICIRHINAEVGMTNKTGQALYLETFNFYSIPPMKRGDIFVFDEIAYVVDSFEIHKRLYEKAGKAVMDRVIVVTHEINKVISGQTAILTQVAANPLCDFIETC